jgi:hypothetical protein
MYQEPVGKLYDLFARRHVRKVARLLAEALSLFTVLDARLSLIVTTRIVLLGDVPMRTISYPALVGGACK